MSTALSSEQFDALAEAVARRVVEKLRGEPVAPGGLLDAAEVASRHGVSRAFVYEHADELGAVRLGEVGDGRRPRLRFDPVKVAAFFERDVASVRGRAATRSEPASTHRSQAPLLEIRGQGGGRAA